jgi:hypothetical protein
MRNRIDTIVLSVFEDFSRRFLDFCERFEVVVCREIRSHGMNVGGAVSGVGVPTLSDWQATSLHVYYRREIILSVI